MSKRNPFTALMDEDEEDGGSGSDAGGGTDSRSPAAVLGDFISPPAVASAPIGAGAKRAQKKAQKRAKRQKREIVSAAATATVEDESEDEDQDREDDDEEEDGTAHAADEDDDAAPGDATVPSSVGLSTSDVACTARTLLLLESHPLLLEHASLKALRTALAPLVTRLGAKWGTSASGPSLKTLKQRKQSGKSSATLEYELALDASARNATALRATRLKKLETLNGVLDGDAAGEALRARRFRVPDGVAITDGRTEDVSMQLLTDGRSSGHSNGGGRLLLTNGSSTDAASNAPTAASAATAAPATLIHALKCYICKTPYKELHHFYDSLCPACAKLNYAKRELAVDMTGKIVLLTGARVKIGYRILVKLLRCGAFVIATTRFPTDLTARLRREVDFADFRDRVHCYGLDFRNLTVLEHFVARMYDKYTHLDAIINNACQTVRRPPAYYTHLMAAERLAFDDLAVDARLMLAEHHEFATDAGQGMQRLGGGGVDQGLRLQSGSAVDVQVPAVKSASSSSTAAPQQFVRPAGSTITIEEHDGDEDMAAEEIVAKVRAQPTVTPPTPTAAASASKPTTATAAATPASASASSSATAAGSKKRSRRGAMRAAEVEAEQAASAQQVVVSGSTEQTFHASSLAAESTQLALLPSDAMSASEHAALFPEGEVDVNGQQVDLRATNSWTMRLEDVPIGEAAEVQAVNFLAPFLLNSKLKKLMIRGNERKTVPRFIVNVSAMEGKFYRFKSSNHPHTNAAKAALNMMTRTSAQDYVRSAIFMTAADTGWINDENPLPKAAEIAAKHQFQTPLDEIDAAMRVLDPILTPLIDFAASKTKNLKDLKIPYGYFIKDYVKCEW